VRERELIFLRNLQQRVSLLHQFRGRRDVRRSPVTAERCGQRGHCYSLTLARGGECLVVKRSDVSRCRTQRCLLASTLWTTTFPPSLVGLFARTSTPRCGPPGGGVEHRCQLAVDKAGIHHSPHVFVTDRFSRDTVVQHSCSECLVQQTSPLPNSAVRRQPRDDGHDNVATTISPYSEVAAEDVREIVHPVRPNAVSRPSKYTATACARFLPNAEPFGLDPPMAAGSP
jgi:hypothetical protein